MKGFEDVLEGLSIYLEAFNLSWLTVARVAWHGVPTRDLTRVVTQHLQLDVSSAINEVIISVEKLQNYLFRGLTATC